MTILTVVFMLLFNYLDTLPKLYTGTVVMIITCVNKKKYLDWEYSVTCLVTSPKVHGFCRYDRGIPNFKGPQQNWPIAWRKNLSNKFVTTKPMAWDARFVQVLNNGQKIYVFDLSMN